MSQQGSHAGGVALRRTMTGPHDVRDLDNSPLCRKTDHGGDASACRRDLLFNTLSWPAAKHRIERRPRTVAATSGMSLAQRLMQDKEALKQRMSRVSDILTPVSTEFPHATAASSRRAGTGRRPTLSTADSSPSSDTDNGSERAAVYTGAYTGKGRGAAAAFEWSPSKSRQTLRPPRPLPPTPGVAPVSRSAAPATAASSDSEESVRFRAQGDDAAAGARWRSGVDESTPAGTASGREAPPRGAGTNARREQSNGGVQGPASAQGGAGDESFAVRLADARADAARARRAQREAEEKLESIKRQLGAQKAAAAREAQRARALEEELELARSEAAEARGNLKRATQEYAGSRGHALRAGEDLAAARDRALQEAREAREARDVLSRELERAAAVHGAWQAGVDRPCWRPLTATTSPDPCCSGGGGGSSGAAASPRTVRGHASGAAAGAGGDGGGPTRGAGAPPRGEAAQHRGGHLARVCAAARADAGARGRSACLTPGRVG